jgi:hypothetical protein
MSILSLMKILGYRYERFCITYSLLAITFIFFIIFLGSCKKKETSLPNIYLKTDTGYVYKDTTMAVGNIFKIELTAEYGGDVNLTNIVIRNEHDGIITNYFDTGVNTKAIRISKPLTKNVYDVEKWTFIAIDKNGGSASVSFITTKDPNSQFGQIKNYYVTMGAQLSTLSGSFLSLNSGRTFFQDSAFLHQDSIEMLYYYDAIGSDANTIASPNANIDASVYTGSSGLSNWTIKNETRYYKTTLSYNDFSTAMNDSILLVSYSEINGKRKAKNLIAGDIYSFKTIHNKYGLFYVENVSGLDTGYITVKILIQK